MISELEAYFVSKEEPVRSTLLALRSYILNYNDEMSESWTHRMPMFRYKGKVFCYLWIDHKTYQPYMGIYKVMLTRQSTPGVTFTSDLNWNKHKAITVKANSTLSFLKGNLQINDATLKATAYRTQVRPQVEYTSNVWEPFTKRNIARIEIIHRRAPSSVTNRLNDLK